MKIKIRNSKTTGETFVQYGDRFNIKKYRFKLLRNIIKGSALVTLVVDTNQKLGEATIEGAEEYLKQSGIKYSAFPARQNSMKFFGFDIQRKTINQKIFVLEISGEEFSSELYDVFLKDYDVAIGFDRLKPFEEICDILKIDISAALFDREFFRESIYDSVVCGSLRSSADIRPYVEAAINEAAL